MHVHIYMYNIYAQKILSGCIVTFEDRYMHTHVLYMYVYACMYTCRCVLHVIFLTKIMKVLLHLNG